MFTISFFSFYSKVFKVHSKSQNKHYFEININYFPYFSVTIVEAQNNRVVHDGLMEVDDIKYGYGNHGWYFKMSI